jgi:hypothetical protein
MDNRMITSARPMNTNARATDVSERQRRDHPDQVFDDEESQDRIAHRQTHVLETGSRDRAQDRVKNQPDQHLHVEAHRKNAAAQVVDW